MRADPQPGKYPVLLGNPLGRWRGWRSLDSVLRECAYAGQETGRLDTFPRSQEEKPLDWEMRLYVLHVQLGTRSGRRSRLLADRPGPVQV